MCAIESVYHQTIDTLSKGYRRRAGLAQALIHDPQVLILDEPTDGLDPNQKHEVRQLINEMAGDKCIIISTHILEEVEEVCNRVIIIARGKILVDSTPAELKEKYKCSLDEAFRKITKTKKSA
jgi:ABC-2 type transport system ATP-binding protein